MTILVTGGTGTIGSRVLAKLAGEDVGVRALTRDPGKAKFPDGVVPVKGDMLDVAAMREALAGVSTLFLLNAVAPSELSEALLTLDLARETGIRRVVYFSVHKAAHFTEVPHFAAKAAVERTIDQFAIPATVLRPNYFMQNDVMFKDALLGPGVYPSPVGAPGVSMVDARDIAEVAAKALLIRERASEPLPRHDIELVGPEALTGDAVAAIWSGLLSKPVRYAGDDLAAFEARTAQHAPGWMAMDLRLMFGAFQREGMGATPSEVEALTKLLGRPPRAYADFAAETAAQWRS